MENKLIVTAAPHITSPDSTQSIMGRVCLALAPALIASVIIFGFNALILTAVTVAACVFFEWAYCKLMGREIPIADFSAVVTGLLLAFNMPATLPWWMAIVGAFIAIVIIKQLFGGLGQNFMNPALGGRAFLMLCYPVAMTTWALAGTGNWAPLGMSVGQDYIDAFTGATPLSIDFMHGAEHILPNATLADVFVGNVGGCIGEVSALLLIVGGVYLIWRGVIRARIPVAFIATVAVLTFLFPLGGNDRITWMLYHLCSGGLMLGAFFMATDYVTSPTTDKGKLVAGIFLGVVTMLIRKFGNMNEGVSFAILLMNLMVPYIDALTRQDKLGIAKKKEAAAK